ncbi:YicC/YloC family endoribonuclease [Candidatus Syntrophosphaera thermopropionivorans]|uniref:YicC family protein n=1 Tax=Candidatus Syntrophosphaera thermopropionivorans TaxID=2593015 RepID=A0AC61QI01_9BACT|nr:YicC/YloC family endoribonuclease [Candidatus Syntrophosphaera thermopropionivorans]TDF72584.1 YicC family protein [Candidatus Syntrophosphaera thermopropionivorans]
MKSMTGYGKAKIQKNDMDCEIEIKSINGRFLDMRIYLPREISFFEYPIRQHIGKVLSRGTVEIRVTFADRREPALKLNEVKLMKYYELVKQAQALLDIDKDISLEYLLNEPGIIESINNLDEDEQLAELLNQTLDKAIEALELSLRAEASNIKETLRHSSDLMLKTLDNIEKEIQPFKEELYSILKHRVTELLSNFNAEMLEQRLVQELAIYIDKYDIQEEISRLKCHINTLLATLEKEEDTGKTLNFILQEMQREANTLGSKFSTARTFTYVLTLKEEIEKCREIVQNVA